MNAGMGNDQLLRAMLATASRRGQLFVTGEHDTMLPIASPVACRHDAHPDVKGYSADDIAFLSQSIGKGDLFYAGGLNLLVPLSIGPEGSLLCFSVAHCRPEWRLPAELKMGDWVFRSPPHWDLIDRDFLRSLPA